MRNQLNIVAASVALAVSGGANAGALGAAHEIFVGGATAPQNFYREDIVQRICDPSAAAVQVFTDGIGVLPEETPGGNILETKDQQVVRCTARSNFTGAAADLNGQDIAIYKFNGGSATGVAPVAAPDAADPGTMQYLDATLTGPDACTAVTNSQGNNAWPIGSTSNTYELYECPSQALLKTQKPDAGISDVEPTLFTGPLALDFGTEPTGVDPRPTQPFVDKGNLNIKPGPGLVYGVGVSLPMYNELIRLQSANGMLPADCATGTAGEKAALRCMPTIPSAVVRDVSAGNITSWADVDFFGDKLNPANVPEGNNVHFCKRTNGSGTHAQFSVHYQGTNCTSTSNQATAEQNDGFSSASFGFVGVYGNSGSSDMNDCLDALGNGKGFNGDFSSLPPTPAGGGDSTVVMGTDLPAITNPNDPLGRPYNTEIKAYGMGYNSLEKNNSLSFDYRFVKVDGVAPTLENAINNTYKDVYYLSFQNRVAGGVPDLRTGSIRGSVSPANVDVAAAYFSTWNAITPAAVNVVNKGLVVDPDNADGAPNVDGDEWETGFVTPIAGASSAFTSGTPATPWTRQNPAGGADSCQDMSLVN